MIYKNLLMKKIPFLFIMFCANTNAFAQTKLQKKYLGDTTSMIDASEFGQKRNAFAYSKKYLFEPSKQPILLLNGKIYRDSISYRISKLDNNKIKETRIYNDSASLVNFGELGKNSVVEVFLKNKKQDSVSDINGAKTITIYNKAETEASYNGSWDNFVKQNTLIPLLKFFNFNNKNTYNVQFVVTKYGEIERIQFEQKHIPIIVQKEVERLLLLSSGKWKHCTQNGSVVNCYSAFTFEF